ncbi:MAG: hypothetical protein JW726_16295 [Anaerolineales bacterium]|nr:hypothetical protein [Anaerolineales bacterium]
MKKLLKSEYIIAGIIVFVIVFIIGLVIDFSFWESLLGAAVLSIVGIVVLWWQREGL